MSAPRGRAEPASRRGGRSADLDGSALDDSATALLIIDAINDFSFPEAAPVLADARPMARRIHQLKAQTRRAGIPAVYVNDNFGRWRSDFRSLVTHCLAPGQRGRAVARLLQPEPRDYFVLKPKHSGFYSTALELLLEHLGARTLILTGLLADMCILFTAHDAYMRGYELVVPADCVAARTPRDRTRALAHMRRVLRADTRPSARLDVRRLSRRGDRPARSR